MVSAAPVAQVLFSIPSGAPRLSEAALQTAYGLTPAEARLAAGLCSGRTLAEHAEQVGVSLNTAKFHLRSVFQKTGQARQADLQRVLLTNPSIRSESAGSTAHHAP